MPGYHLPYLAAAAADGLFAHHGFDTELVDPPASGGVDSVVRTAAGGTDFCITSVGYYLMARARVPDLAARFIAVVGRRHPIAGLVAAHASLEVPSDLGGRRVGAMPGDRLAADYEAALTARGIAPPVRVPVAYADGPAALARGDIDVVADFADLVPRARKWSGIDVRAIPVGLAHYANGIVAGDHVPDERVAAMRTAVAEALELQRTRPETGLDALRQRCPDVDPADAMEGWSIAAPNIFADGPPGAMNHDAWAATIAQTALVHDVAPPDPASVYRTVEGILP